LKEGAKTKDLKGVGKKKEGEETTARTSLWL